ncbi:hypothetical protein NHX12_019385 [Muraenolepis orangiensis]|uniref:Ig-like domain-containing protein n=1 Tax=Muraenolepis orangiensis TaxID=630683 RepID=A0A9Q0EV98_9TELE|nr:hypothetical protein NHX12_019385 [Muraenolepis orangiensis]
MRTTLLLSIITINLIRFKGAASPQHHQVVQKPAAVLVDQNRPRPWGNLSCTHQVPTFDTILWYRQLNRGRNRMLELIAYVYYTQRTVEASFEGHFAVYGDGEKWSTLDLLKLRGPEDTEEYYCAASVHRDEEPMCACTKTPTRVRGRDERGGENHHCFLLVGSICGGERDFHELYFVSVCQSEATDQYHTYSRHSRFIKYH